MLQIVTKTLSFHQPVGFAPPIEAVAAPVNLYFLKYTLGNMNIGGTWLCGVYSDNHCGIIPLSPELKLCTCLCPLSQIIVGGA
jgi:hypothetical protein